MILVGALAIFDRVVKLGVPALACGLLFLIVGIRGRLFK